MSEQKSILKNVIYSIVKTICLYAFPLMSFMYAARVLGVDGIGNVDFSKNYVSFFIIVAVLGTDLYGLREGARIRDNRDALSQLTQELLIINIISTFFSITVLYLTFFVFPEKLLAHKGTIVIFSFAILLSGIGLEWLFMALEEYKYITLRAVIFQIVALVLLFLFVKTEDDLIPYTIICMLSGYGSLLLNIFYCRKYVDFRKRKLNLKQHMIPLLWLFIMNISISLYTLLDTTMLGFIKGDYEVGLYTAAIKLNKVLNALISAIGAVFVPRLAYYVGKGEYEKYDTMVIRLTQIIAFVAIPLFVGCFLFRKTIILLFCGEKYVEANAACGLLSLLLLILPISVLVNKQILIPMRSEKKVIIATTCGAVVNIVLNYFLIPVKGHLGASIATVIAESVVSIICLYMARKVLRVSVLIKEYAKNLIAIMPMFLTAFICNKFQIGNVATILIAVAVGGVGYILILALCHNVVIDMCRNRLRKKKDRR